MAQRTPRYVDDRHFGVTCLHIVTEFWHRREADGCNVKLSLGIFFWHLRRRYGLGDENHSLTPVEKDRLPHFHDYREGAYELLRIIVLDKFPDNDSLQWFVGNFYGRQMSRPIVAVSGAYLFVRTVPVSSSGLEGDPFAARGILPGYGSGTELVADY